MTEGFEIDVKIKNEEKKFDAEFRKLGYSYKIAVWIDGHEVIYEPDEERNFRAITVNQTMIENKKFLEWVRATAERLTELFEK